MATILPFAVLKATFACSLLVPLGAVLARLLLLFGRANVRTVSASKALTAKPGDGASGSSADGPEAAMNFCVFEPFSLFVTACAQKRGCACVVASNVDATSTTTPTVRVAR